MKKLILILTLATIITINVPVYAQQPEVFITEKAAVNGYDVVGYFTKGAAVKGKKEFTHSWNGASWLFSSKENLELFKANPEKYAPEYGGYCAYGMSRGYKAPTQPDAWTIVDDKLYLNYNKDVRSEWTKKQTEYIEKANTNWPSVKKE